MLEAKRRKKDEDAKKEKAEREAKAAEERVAAAKAAAEASASASALAAATAAAVGRAASATPRIPQQLDQITEPCFDVMKGTERVERLNMIGKLSWMFGRAADQVDFKVIHESCSRQHARVTFSQGHFFITDLGSAHGTSIDGRRLARDQDAYLSPGANVRFGASTRVYIFRMPRLHSPAMVQMAKMSKEQQEKQMRAQPQPGAGLGSGRFRYRSTMGGANSDFADG